MSGPCISSPIETPLDGVLSAILRAGLAHPTPAGLLSALRAAHGLLARYAPAPELPERDADQIDHVIIPVGAGEHWCGHCGAVVNPAMGLTGAVAECCSRPQPLSVVACLRPEEYVVKQ